MPMPMTIVSYFALETLHMKNEAKLHKSYSHKQSVQHHFMIDKKFHIVFANPKHH